MLIPLHGGHDDQVLCIPYSEGESLHVPPKACVVVLLYPCKHAESFTNTGRVTRVCVCG